MTTEIELVNDRHYMDRLPDLAEQYAASQLCTKQFQGKPELVKIIGYQLAELNMRLNPGTIGMCYVVGNKPGYEAQLQIVLASRWGCHIVPLDEESGDTRAVVNALAKDRKWHRVTVTMDEAVRAGWPARNPNYATMPDRMLAARAVTKAIGQHCPEAKLLLPPADLDELPSAGDDPVEPHVEMVTAGRARTQLVERYMARGADRAHARTYAALLWRSHELSDDDPIPAGRWERILTVFDEHPRAEPSIGIVAPETTGGPPVDTDTGEIIDAETSPMFDESGRPF